MGGIRKGATIELLSQPFLSKKTPILEIKNLSISFPKRGKGLDKTAFQTIRNMELAVYSGEIVAVVGASGSGKSLLANAVMGLLPKNAVQEGTMNYKGKPLTEKRQKQLRGREIALIPQSINSLDPLMKTEKFVKSMMRGNNKKKRLEEIFKRLRLPAETSTYYPYQLSGGMARRILIASALASEAELIIADEPTPGLDSTSLDEFIQIMKQIPDKKRALVLITHDIQTAVKTADRIAVFYAGETVEIAKASHFSGNGNQLKHPYTKALWNALPENGFLPVPGSQPFGDEISLGCIFEPRCSIAQNDCKKFAPESSYSENEMVRCFYAGNEKCKLSV